MDIVQKFKDYLLREKNKPSNVTIKNYLSDVRRFITWYESTYGTTFQPQALNTEITTAYQKKITDSVKTASSSTSSTKRYISSLRKFTRFLRESGAIEANPFELSTPIQNISDPWMLKQFKNHLELQKASRLTVKNYLIDTQQFLTWLAEVTKGQENIEVENRFLQIDHFAITQYKNRLLHDAKLSPPSINRKLSSLRRYLRWLTEKGVLAKEELIEAPEPVNAEPEIKKPETLDMPLASLLELPAEPEAKKPVAYSSFAPIRLMQKTSGLAKLGIGTFIWLPIIKSAESLEYILWKRNGKQVFTPVKTMLEQAGHTAPQVVAEAIKEEPTRKAVSSGAAVAASTASIMQDFINSKASTKPYAVRNISKAFYAPLKISLTHLPFRDRLIHHVRYTRPEWYRTYHSYPVVHHMHLGILLLAMSAACVGIFYTAGNTSQDRQQVYADIADGSPRTIAFQGRLADENDTPISKATKLRFSLYSSEVASGAALLWQEVQTITPNQTGAFKADLGKQARIDQSLFKDNPNLYIGMAVENNPELKPRQHLPTTEYAKNSQTVQGLKPITEDNTVAENVLLALDSTGDLTIGGTASPTFQATGGEFTLSGQAMTLTTAVGSNGNITLNPDGTGNIDLQGALQNTTDYNNLGTTGGAVRVADEFIIATRSNGRSALEINQNGSGDIISSYSNGDAKFRLDTAGNALFAGNLFVNGNTIGTTSTSFGIANNNVVNLTIGRNANALSLGASSGITTINNSIEVNGSTTLKGTVNTQGLLTASAGITLPTGQKLTFEDFTPGLITYINSTKQLAQDPSFKWNDISNALTVNGSICVQATAANCAGAVPGTIYASNATVQAADLAENYISAEPLEPGDVVIPEGKNNNLAVSKSTNAYQPQVIGIISTKPGFTLNSDAQTSSEHPYKYPLALQGRVPVKVTTVNGDIKAGDALTSSPVPGIAMKATQPGQIIGKALESFSGSSQGKVMAFVNLSHYSSPTTLTAEGDLNYAKTLASAADTAINKDDTKILESLNISNGIVESLAASIITAGDLSTQSLQVMSEKVTINGKDLVEYIKEVATSTIIPAPETTPKATISQSDESAPTASVSASDLYTQTATQSAFASSHSALLAEPEPTIAASQAAHKVSSATEGALFTQPKESSKTDAQLKDLQDRIELLESQMRMETFQASSAAELGIENVQSQELDDLVVSDTVSVLGRTTLSDVGITGTLSMGLLAINGIGEGAATINTTSGPLKLQAHGLHGIDFMDGKMALDPKGNLDIQGHATFAQDVTIKGKLATNIIAPIPGNDVSVQNHTGKDVVKISEKGDIKASGSGSFANLSIVRGVQADSSNTITRANASAGKGVIRAHEIERTIYTPYITEKSLVYVTATSNTKDVIPYVARQTVAKGKTEASFTIQVPHEVDRDISFNWWIVN